MLFNEEIKRKLPFQGIIFILDSRKLPTSISEQAWLSEKEAKTGFYYPISLMVNGFTKIAVITNPLYINVETKVRQWKNSLKVPCYEDRDWIEGNETCYDACSAKFFPPEENGVLRRKYTKVIFSNKNDTGIFFNNPENVSEIIEAERNPSLFVTSDQPLENKREQDSYKKCIEKCRKIEGCRVWSYHINHVLLSNFDSSRRIQMLIYPSSVDVMKEVELQTWQNFIANVGGMLGIWTGASVLTFLQIIYLFCCQGRAEDDH